MPRKIFIPLILCSCLLFLSACQAIGQINTVTLSAEKPEPGGVIRHTENWQELFAGFLSENYELLASAGDIAGVGFIDLDIDGVPELLLFYDSGSSAAMDVALFGLNASGSVYPDARGPEKQISACLFEDFRLMQDPKTGTRFFIVESLRSADDFDHSELVLFAPSPDDFLSLTLLLGRYKGSDPSTGEYIDELFTQNGVKISADEYARCYRLFFDYFTDTGYDAAGTFVWEKISYEDEGFMSMVENSIKIYKPLP